MVDPALLFELKDMHPFRDLTQEEVEKIAEAGKLVTLKKEEKLEIGGDEETPFYLVLDGFLALEDLKADAEKKLGTMRPGDFFGADYMLYEVIRRTRVTAGEHTQLLELQPGDLANFIRNMPRLKDGLLKSLDTTIRLRSKFFRWVNESEHVKLVLRQHPMFLVEALSKPVLGLIGGLLVTYIGSRMEIASFRIAVTSTGWGMLAFFFLWAAWNAFDYLNDYYIITNQRVVWLEQVFGLYESRREAVLSAIKSTDIKTSWWGRLFGYGNLAVFALMGEVRLDHIANPHQVRALIEYLQKRATERSKSEDTQAIERLIRKKIDPPPAAAPKPFEYVKPVDTKKAARPVFDLKEFFNMETRYVKGDTITYRKHHIILITKIFAPLTGLIAVIVGASYFLYRSTAGISAFPSPGATMLIALFLAPVFLFWLWYQYVDWHNDIYQITPDKIIDSERKPLGTEATKSAPLVNIQNMDYERIGILGLLLNYGSVQINTGSDNVMIWYKIHDPARAQMDIFNNLYLLRQRQQSSESSRNWDQWSDFIAAYHRQAEELRKSREQREGH